MRPPVPVVLPPLPIVPPVPVVRPPEPVVRPPLPVELPPVSLTIPPVPVILPPELVAPPLAVLPPVPVVLPPLPPEPPCGSRTARTVASRPLPARRFSRIVVAARNAGQPERENRSEDRTRSIISAHVGDCAAIGLLSRKEPRARMPVSSRSVRQSRLPGPKTGSDPRQSTWMIGILAVALARVGLTTRPPPMRIPSATIPTASPAAALPPPALVPPEPPSPRAPPGSSYRWGSVHRHARIADLCKQQTEPSGRQDDVACRGLPRQPFLVMETASSRARNPVTAGAYCPFTARPATPTPR